MGQTSTNQHPSNALFDGWKRIFAGPRGRPLEVSVVWGKTIIDAEVVVEPRVISVGTDEGSTRRERLRVALGDDAGVLEEAPVGARRVLARPVPASDWLYEIDLGGFDGWIEDAEGRRQTFSKDRVEVGAAPLHLLRPGETARLVQNDLVLQLRYTSTSAYPSPRWRRRISYRWLAAIIPAAVLPVSVLSILMAVPRAESLAGSVYRKPPAPVWRARGIVIHGTEEAGQNIGAAGADSHTVWTHREEIRHCFERELTRMPGLSGRLVLVLRIDPEGDVTSAKIVDSEIGYAPLEDCIVARAATWPFTPTRFLAEPTPASPRVVRYPMYFRASD